MEEATVEDRTVEFLLRHATNNDGTAAALPPLASLSIDTFQRKPWREAFDEEQADLRQRIWGLKTQLDDQPNELYMSVRDRLFPLAMSGKAHNFSNRAGHKLLECMEATEAWQPLQDEVRRGRKSQGRRRRGRRVVAFADLCGGPGAFSQALFAASTRKNIPTRNLSGYGMTLGEVDNLDWYPELRTSTKRRFTITYGLDGSGNIFSQANVEALATLTADEQMLLVVADGGFHVDFSMANYQEPISARITYAQWWAALKILSAGGSFVLKLFDTFTPSTRAILFLSTFLYTHVHVVKPRHSRVVNSERYLVCVGFVGAAAMPPGWMHYLTACYVNGFHNNEEVPDIIPTAWMDADAVFMADLREMNGCIGSNQCTALGMVLRGMKESSSAAVEPLSVPSQAVC